MADLRSDNAGQHADLRAAKRVREPARPRRTVGGVVRERKVLANMRKVASLVHLLRLSRMHAADVERVCFTPVYRRCEKSLQSRAQETKALRTRIRSKMKIIPLDRLREGAGAAVEVAEDEADMVRRGLGRGYSKKTSLFRQRMLRAARHLFFNR